MYAVHANICCPRQSKGDEAAHLESASRKPLEAAKAVPASIILLSALQPARIFSDEYKLSKIIRTSAFEKEEID